MDRFPFPSELPHGSVHQYLNLGVTRLTKKPKRDCSEPPIIYLFVPLQNINGVSRQRKVPGKGYQEEKSRNRLSLTPPLSNPSILLVSSFVPHIPREPLLPFFSQLWVLRMHRLCTFHHRCTRDCRTTHLCTLYGYTPNSTSLLLTTVPTLPKLPRDTRENRKP